MRELSETSAVISARNVTDTRVTVSNCVIVTVWNGQRYEVPGDGACFAIGLPLLAGEERLYSVAVPNTSQPARAELSYSRENDVSAPTAVQSVRIQIR